MLPRAFCRLFSVMRLPPVMLRAAAVFILQAFRDMSRALFASERMAVMKKIWYEKLLFVIALAGWTVCCLLFVYAAVFAFPFYNGLWGKAQQAPGVLRQLKLPVAVLALSLFLMNLVVRKLRTSTAVCLLLSCLLIPIAQYAYSRPDFILGPYVTAGISFFGVPFLLRRVYGDLIRICAGIGKAQNFRKKVRCFLFWLFAAFSALMTVCLCIASFSGHILAQTIAFFAFSLPYPLALQLVLMSDAAEGRFSGSGRCCMDMLSAALPAYLMIRCFYPDNANRMVIIGLFSLLAVFAGLLLFRLRKQKRIKKEARRDGDRAAESAKQKAEAEKG